MNLGFLARNFEISRRKFVAVTLLNMGSLAWFFMLYFNNKDISALMTTNNPDWVKYSIGLILFLGFAILIAVVISFIGRQINRRKLLTTSVLLGTSSTILMAFLEGTIPAAVLFSLAGLSLGLGLPSSLSLVADYTVVEDRARVSGILIFGTFIVKV